MLTKIAVNGQTKRLRARALATLGTTQSLNTSRVALSESGRSWLESVGPAGWGALATAGLPHRVRTISTAHNHPRLPGDPVRREGEGPTNDRAVDEAYDYMGATFDFFWEVFDRDSIDDNGLPLNGTVHFDEDYDNAYWDGRRMVYGDGDQELFDRFTKSIDVIGHELTHGVTQFESGLIYWAQAGALNESLSDAFGSMVKQYVRGEKASEADWLIGEGLLMPAVAGQAIRSMADPGSAYDDPVLGKDPQPAHMRDYERTFQDSGGVHINSGIPNKAFYLAATSIGGYSWEGAGAIWYETLLSPLLRRGMQFQPFAKLTTSIARQLFPGGDEEEAVRAAWADVGISA